MCDRPVRTTWALRSRSLPSRSHHATPRRGRPGLTVQRHHDRGGAVVRIAEPRHQRRQHPENPPRCAVVRHELDPVEIRLLRLACGARQQHHRCLRPGSDQMGRSVRYIRRVGMSNQFTAVPDRQDDRRTVLRDPHYLQQAGFDEYRSARRPAGGPDDPAPREVPTRPRCPQQVPACLVVIPTLLLPVAAHPDSFDADDPYIAASAEFVTCSRYTVMIMEFVRCLAGFVVLRHLGHDVRPGTPDQGRLAAVDRGHHGAKDRAPASTTRADQRRRVGRPPSPSLDSGQVLRRPDASGIGLIEPA